MRRSGLKFCGLRNAMKGARYPSHPPTHRERRAIHARDKGMAGEEGIRTFNPLIQRKERVSGVLASVDPKAQVAQSCSKCPTFVPQTSPCKHRK